MSKLIAHIHPKWLYRSDEVAHIYKLCAIYTYWLFDLTVKSDNQNVDYD